MELRQKEQARDVDKNDMKLRPIINAGLLGGRAISSSAKCAGRGGVRAGKFASNTVKYYSLEREGRQAVKYLSREQKKQWNSYSRHEQERILKTVNARVERRMRFRSETASDAYPKERKPDRSQITQAYRQQESPKAIRSTGSSYFMRREDRPDPKTDNMQIKQGNKDMSIRMVGTQRYKESERTESARGMHDAKRSGFDSRRENIYVNPYISRPMLQRIRQKRAQDLFFVQKGSSPRIREEPMGRDQETASKGQIMNGRVNVRRMYIIRTEEGADNKEIRLKNELEHLAGGPDGHRHTIHTVSMGRNDKGREAEKTFYTHDRSKTNRKFQKEKRRIRKIQKKEMAEKSSMFRRELAGIIDKDIRKQSGMNQAMRLETMELSEIEQETVSGTLSMVLLPERFAAARVTAAVRRQLIRIGTSLLKYAAFVGGILFLLLFIVMLFAAILGGISSEMENSSAQYSTSGSAIVEYAQSWINITKYSYGAGRNSETDWQDVSDCSSFVHGVFSYFGISVGWDTYAMESDGTVVGTNSLENAIAGDLILFYNGTIASGNSYHVGIYAGNGEMVHNSTSKGCVIQAPVTYSGTVFEVRRIVSGASSGYSIDSTNYTLEQLQTIWAVVCQEDGGSYEGALAVISTAMNRVNSPRWASYGKNAYEQLTASGQFCYSIETNWKKYLGGNVPDHVKQAVSDCLDRGIRNHPYTSFRAYYTEGSVQIGGGNYYF